MVTLKNFDLVRAESNLIGVLWVYQFLLKGGSGHVLESIFSVEQANPIGANTRKHKLMI